MAFDEMNPLGALHEVSADKLRAYAKVDGERALQEEAKKVVEKKERPRSQDETEKIIENIKWKIKYSKKDAFIDNTPSCNVKDKGEVHYRNTDM